MDIQVIQESNELQYFNKVAVKRGCYQQIKIVDKQAHYLYDLQK